MIPMDLLLEAALFVGLATLALAAWDVADAVRQTRARRERTSR